MAREFIEVEKREHLTIVTINRPEVMNALHPPACRDLDEAFNDFSEDPNAWAAILTGAGDRAFCAGNDLKWQAEYGADALRKGLDPLKGGFGGIFNTEIKILPYPPLVKGGKSGLFPFNKGGT